MSFEEKGGSDTKYVLLWDKGIQGDPTNTELFSTDQTSFERVIESGTKYNFAVRAKNRCGSGIVSQNQAANFVSQPRKISLVRTTSDSLNCGYQITWVAPNDGGSPITSYSVKLRARGGEYRELTQCGTDPKTTTCPLTEEELIEYGVNLDDYIVAKVSAVNAIGVGRSAQNNKSTAEKFAIGKPTKVESLDYGKTSLKSDSVLIGWAAVPNAATYTIEQIENNPADPAAGETRKTLEQSFTTRRYNV